MERELPSGAREQIGAADHIGHALLCVVDHRSQRVGVQAVSAAYDDVAVRQRIEMDFAQTSIDHRHRFE